MGASLVVKVPYRPGRLKPESEKGTVSQGQGCPSRGGILKESQRQNTGAGEVAAKNQRLEIKDIKRKLETKEKAETGNLKNKKARNRNRRQEVRNNKTRGRKLESCRTRSHEILRLRTAKG